jgi:uncharacterized protein DUF4352
MGKLVALALAGGFVLTGCQSGTTNTPDPVVATTADKVEQPVASQSQNRPAPKPGQATIGSTITLKGIDDGERVAVTLVKIVNNAPGADEFNQPPSGKVFIAVQIRMRNTGTAGYDDSPSNGAKLLDGAGQQYEVGLNDVKSGPSLPAVTKMPPGGNALGFLVFEVPKGTTPTTFQFALNSGYADQTGQWSI